MIYSRYVRTLLTGLVVAAAAPLLAFAGPASIAGHWMTQDKGAVIHIAPCGSAVCGTVAKFLKTPPQGVDQRDVRNPNKALRNRKIMGMPILTGFVAKGVEWHGNIYDPQSGKTYRSVVYRAKSGGLTVKGCVGPFCQSQKWTAAN